MRLKVYTVCINEDRTAGPEEPWVADAVAVDTNGDLVITKGSESTLIPIAP